MEGFFTATEGSLPTRLKKELPDCYTVSRFYVPAGLHSLDTIWNLILELEVRKEGTIPISNRPHFDPVLVLEL